VAGPSYGEYLKMYMEQVTFAKDELKRREKAPVHIPREKIDREFHGHNWVLLVDPINKRGNSNGAETIIRGGQGRSR